MQQLNDIRFGNPTFEQYQALDKACMVDDLFEPLCRYAFADNDCAVTRKELNQCADNLRTIRTASPKAIKLLDTYLALDRHLLQSMVNYFRKHGLDIETLVKEITADVLPLVDKVRFHYNRMRPNQLASVFQLALFPYENKSESPTPSYPSANTVLGIVILTVLGDHHPDQKPSCDILINDICNSQLYLGRHLQSDVDFAHIVADAILKHHDFVKKYKV